MWSYTLFPRVRAHSTQRKKLASASIQFFFCAGSKGGGGHCNVDMGVVGSLIQNDNQIVLDWTVTSHTIIHLYLHSVHSDSDQIKKPQKRLTKVTGIKLR